METYKEARQHVRDLDVIPILEECRNSHALRVQKLRDRLRELGHTPQGDGGLWGEFAKLAERSATMLGDQAAIGLLAAGEDYGLKQYECYLPALDLDSWKIAKEELLPGQGRTQLLSSILNAQIRSQCTS